MSMTPQDLQKLLDEPEASRVSRKRVWENLRATRWVLQDTTAIELPPPARRTIDLKGRLAKNGLRKALWTDSMLSASTGSLPTKCL